MMPTEYPRAQDLPAWVDDLPDDMRAAAARNAEERAAQGLPPFVENPVALDRCARILATPGGTIPAEQGRGPG